MAIPKDYFCDGQLNIWGIMSQVEKPEEPEVCESEENLQEEDINNEVG